MRSFTFRASIALPLAGAFALASATGASALEITVNGQMTAFNPGPLMQAGRVFLPLRAVFEALGASVVYQGGVINATGRRHTVSLKIGSTTATVDGQAQQLDTPPFIVGASTYVPLRFVSQALGARVGYDAANQVVSLVTGPGGPGGPGGPPPGGPGQGPHELVSLSPDREQTVGSQRPTISGSFRQPVDPGSVHLFLDGRDVTPGATISPSGYIYAPPSPLQSQPHAVRVTGNVPGGSPFDETYTFVSGNAAYFNTLDVRQPPDGAAVGPSFTIDGRSVPGAHIHVVAGVTQSVGGFAFGTGSFHTDVQADGDGHFSVPVTLQSFGGGSIGVTIVSTDPRSGESAEKKLHLHAQ